MQIGCALAAFGLHRRCRRRRAAQDWFLCDVRFPFWSRSSQSIQSQETRIMKQHIYDAIYYMGIKGNVPADCATR